MRFKILIFSSITSTSNTDVYPPALVDAALDGGADAESEVGTNALASLPDLGPAFCCT